MQNDLVNKKVRNDGLSLEEALTAHYQLVSLQYIGEFVFLAECVDGSFLWITTMPVDESQDTIQIVDIKQTF